jgi:PhzF family phenazine biosynthesis protein
MNILNIAAFSDGHSGGNPAGVVIQPSLPSDSEMQRIAAELGFSETVFAMPQGQGWRVRYFSPEAEVPFCGHATIALGAALALHYGNGNFPLQLNQASISVSGEYQQGQLSAALQSPPTRSAPVPAALLQEALALFGLSPDQLSPDLPPALIHAGADHLLLAVQERATLSAMHYTLETGRQLMRRAGLTTILLLWAENRQRFHSRNAFAGGGVYEDPATGAATAALAGYLRDIDWEHGGHIEVIQGEDMGQRSCLHAAIPTEKGSSIRVSGTARLMEPAR